jgi:hypothetical protein
MGGITFSKMISDRKAAANSPAAETALDEGALKSVGQRILLIGNISLSLLIFRVGHRAGPVLEFPPKDPFCTILVQNSCQA